MSIVAIVVLLVAAEVYVAVVLVVAMLGRWS